MNVKIPDCVTKLGTKIVANRSTISTGAGLVAFGITTVSAVKATPKALKLKKAAEDAKGGALTPFETVKACYRPYVLPAIEGAAAVGLILYGKKVDSAAIKDMGAAYAISSSTCKALEKKIEEYAGKEKADEIVDEVTKDVTAQSYIYPPMYANPGEVLCMEPIFGEVFSSTRDRIEAAVDRCNLIMDREQYITYAEFFDALNVNNKGSAKYHLGFNDYTGPMRIVKWTSGLNAQGVPVLVFKFGKDPVTV